MTISKDTFGMLVECDKCSEYFDVDSDDFSDAVDELKAWGWKIRKEDDEWVHVCSSCVRKGQ